ncbi:MAG: ABC transporter ATP-binding protein [Pseudomonadota bacterium]
MPEQPARLAISATGLCKRFGALQAVSGINLHLQQGEALGLLGPNGAGKSTTLSMLLGLLKPDGGTAQIFGHPAGSAAARRLIGATPQATELPDQLTPREILDYTAARYGTSANHATLATRFGLKDLMERRVAGFSGGELRRVALALAFVGRPKLVFLDEPTTGLDTASQEQFRQTAQQFVAAGGTLVLTSHHWDEIEAICNTIALIDHGEVVLTGRIEDIRARRSVHRLSFGLTGQDTPPAWMQATRAGNDWHMETADSDAALRRMVREAIPFEGLTLERLKLKDLIHRIRNEKDVS